MTSYHDLIRPEVINSIKGMELISRVVVDNFFHGLNTSRRIGSGQEFSQYRSYEPGDDLRLLDWKMLARSSRYYIRQSEVDTNVTVKFVLDTTKSMEHLEDGVSKSNLSKVIAASIGYLAHSQGDDICLFTIGEEKTMLQPNMDKQYFNRFLYALTQVECKGKWPQPGNLEEFLHVRKSKELIIFITDFYEHDDELLGFITKQKTPRNELVVIQLAGERELELNYNRSVSLEDLETGELIRLNPEEIRIEHLKSIERRHEKLRLTLIDRQVEYHLLRMNDKLEDSLSTFLKTRNRLMP